MKNRDGIKNAYAVAVEQLIAVMDKMSDSLWSGSAEEERALVDEWKSNLRTANELKKELLQLKTEELAAAPVTERDYLAKLRKKWEGEEVLLSTVFLSKDAPFVFDWERNGDDWINKIEGLKASLPVKSKAFMKDLRDYFLRSKKEVSYN
jgi:hypothetical protein